MGEDKFVITDLVELQAIENAISARYAEIDKVKAEPSLVEAEKNLEESKQKSEEKESQFHDLDLKRRKSKKMDRWDFFKQEQDLGIPDWNPPDF